MRPLFQEKRKKPRRHMRRAAELTFGALGSPIPCVIWDISDGGARLAVACPLADLPRVFTMVLFKGAKVHRKCQVVWKDARFVGVKFI
jgi:hypothetical protein